MATQQQRTRKQPIVRRFLIQGGILFLVWLMLSGHYDRFHIFLGVLSVAAVLWINRSILPFVSSRPDGAYFPIKFERCLFYIPWLAWEMILSGVHVARVVLSPKMHIHPALIRFKSEQPNELARVILGNSITLTPGTLTIEIEEDEFLVHALTDATAAGLVSGSMQTKVARLFVNEPGRMVYDVQTSHSS